MLIVVMLKNYTGCFACLGCFNHINIFLKIGFLLVEIGDDSDIESLEATIEIMQ